VLGPNSSANPIPWDIGDGQRRPRNLNTLCTRLCSKSPRAVLFNTLRNSHTSRLRLGRSLTVVLQRARNLGENPAGTAHLSDKPCEFRRSMQHLLASLLAGVWKAVASAASTALSCRLNQRPRTTVGFLFAHKRHPFNRKSSIRWCCIDLLNSPRLSSKWTGFMAEEVHTKRSGLTFSISSEAGGEETTRHGRIA
jgi:hypothetical protein